MNATNRNEAEDDAGRQWLVLVNAEGQHSLWPVLRPVPEGWNEVGPEGAKADCLAWIAQRWTDMCPLSARAAG